MEVSLDLFYGWGELLLQISGTTAEQCKDEFKEDLFSPNYLMKR